MIFIDGASADATFKVVREFDSSLISTISERDEEIYDAINKGIGMAQGDVIGVLRSNDFFSDTDVLSEVRGTFEKNGSDSLFADVEFFNPDAPDRTVRHYSSARFHSGLLQYGIMPAHPAVFIRQEIFERFGLYRTDMRIAGDFEFVTRIYKEGEISFTYVPKI